MLKKVLSAAILFVAINVSASENYFANEWDAKGLIAIEGTGGQMNFSVDKNASVPGSNNTPSSSISLKLGGESRLYRFFLSGSYFILDAPNTTESKAASLGVQMDYLIRAGEHFNIFMGLNGGGIYSKFTHENAQTGITQNTTSTDPYAGGQIGVNIDIIESLGIELGARAKYVFASDDIYSVDNMYEGYAAIVFKFTGNY